ncbi:hypothetical protein, partial [Burkholderia glumae]|uniref:hypothetical protein n=1 Tax=Burkholderia glumae TaxID=337 RepID=UPI0020CE1406
SARRLATRAGLGAQRRVRLAARLASRRAAGIVATLAAVPFRTRRRVHRGSCLDPPPGPRLHARLRQWA